MNQCRNWDLSLSMFYPIQIRIIRLIHRKLIPAIILSCLFLSVFSLSITAFLHLLNCHQKQGHPNSFEDVAFIHNPNSDCDECYICRFLSNNSITVSDELLSGISRFPVNCKICFSGKSISNPIYLLNFARAPPGI